VILKSRDIVEIIGEELKIHKILVETLTELPPGAAVIIREGMMKRFPGRRNAGEGDLFFFRDKDFLETGQKVDKVRAFLIEECLEDRIDHLIEMSA
jgi:hypothetical protein